ncbi:abortive infection protein [Calothrix sp. NIES-4071]|nr:abortive infection protein [Calothrix sp. NIES-4071]BAZ62159.1 abortive infection protein [Calothrix sp. NIES-4105]
MGILPINQERQKLILIMSLGYILPVLLLYLKIIPFSWRFYLLILTAIATLAITRLYNFSPVELGLTRQRLGISFKVIALPTLAFVLLMLINYMMQRPRIDNSTYQLPFYLFFVGVSSPVQEFLYRGFLFAVFSRAKLAPWLMILLSSLLYSFVHLIYQDVPTLLFTFIIGVLWGIHYVSFRNLYSIILSHSVLGVVAILVGQV